MHMLGGDRRTNQRTLAAFVNRDVRTVAKFKDDADIAAREFKWHVAGHSAETENFDLFGTCKSEHDRCRVVLPGIGVDNDFSALGHDNPVCLDRCLFKLLLPPCQWLL